MSEAAHESPDTFERLAAGVLRRGSVRAALATLAFLFACAIYAPLVANDRPYLLESIDVRGYREAQRALVPMLESLASRVRDREPARAIADEGRAAERQLALMREHLSAADGAALDECSAAIRYAVSAHASGRDADAERGAARAIELGRAIERDFTPQDPGHPERGGKALRAVVRHPLLESLTALDVFFMVLWLALLSAPAWNRLVDRRLFASDPARIRAARAAKLAAVVALSLAAAIAWRCTVGGRAAFASAPYKSAIARGDIRVVRAVFPPIAMGFAETNLAEGARPPTWTSESEISESGEYVRGPRAPRVEPSTRFRPPPAKVEVRIGEPALNSPLRHPLGTDALGRDLLARLLWGARTSLSVGLLSALCLTLVGVAVGALAGWCGGRVDMLVSRAIEIVLCVPAFFLIVSVMAFTDPDVLPPIAAIVIVIALVSWTSVARLVRAELLRLRELEFAVAARALGLSPARIVVRHLLPNALGPVLVAAAFAVASSTLTESALSFLGLGVGEPIPSWGALISGARSADQWWLEVFPGLCLFATVLAYNVVGDGIRDALDPRSAA
jgi:peptide/nickel transport system permease protein